MFLVSMKQTRRGRRIRKVSIRAHLFSLSLCVLDFLSRILGSLVDHLFQPAAFEASFALNIMAEPESSSSSDSTKDHLPLILQAPDLHKHAAAYESWADQLSSVDSPTWLGFSSHAERLLASRQSLSAIGSWSALHLRGNEEAHDFQAIISKTSPGTSRVAAGGGGVGGGVLEKFTRQLSKQMSTESHHHQHGPAAGEGAGGGSSWLTDLLPAVNAIIEMLPPQVPEMKRTEDTVRDPMFRCFERETTVARQ